MTPEELEKVESEVNQRICKNTPEETRLKTPDEAVKNFAMALVVENYFEEVRVMSMGLGEYKPYSVELCRGNACACHRRYRHIQDYQPNQQWRQAYAALKPSPVMAHSVIFHYGINGLKEIALQFRDKKTRKKSSPPRLAGVVSERKKLEKDLAEARKSLAMGGSGGGGKIEPETIGDVKFISKIFDGLDPKELRSVAESYLKASDIVFVATQTEGKSLHSDRAE